MLSGFYKIPPKCLYSNGLGLFPAANYSGYEDIERDKYVQTRELETTGIDGKREYRHCISKNPQ